MHAPSATRFNMRYPPLGGQGQEVIAVLPDSAVRVTLLDFDSLPERRHEAEAAVRFRLRKSLPFDIEKAALSFDAQKTPQGLHVAAAVVLQCVLEEYESAFRDAGCSPGVVMPSSLGALGAVDEDGPTMLLKVGQDATSIAVVKDGQLLLFRILEGWERKPSPPSAWPTTFILRWYIFRTITARA